VRAIDRVMVGETTLMVLVEGRTRRWLWADPPMMGADLSVGLGVRLDGDPGMHLVVDVAQVRRLSPP
jgi:hypothetical protein